MGTVTQRYDSNRLNGTSGQKVPSEFVSGSRRLHATIRCSRAFSPPNSTGRRFANAPGGSAGPAAGGTVMGETTERIRSSGGQAFAISTDGPKLTALCDGYLDLDLSRFPAVVRGVGDGLAAADGQDLDDLCVSVNCFLIEAPGRLCLIDAGDGSRRGASLGHLRRALKAAGYEAGDVTDLLMTHLHGDHAAGLVEAGRPIFPNADLHVSAG